MINRRTVYRRMIKIKRLSQLLIVFCMATAACAQDSLDGGYDDAKGVVSIFE